MHQEKVRIKIKGNMRKRQMKVITLEEYGKIHKFAHISTIIKKIEILCLQYISIIYLSRVLCLSFVLSYSFLSSCHPVILSSCHICGTLSYSLCLRIQTDGVDETEGFEREGYRWRDRRRRD